MESGHHDPLLVIPAQSQPQSSKKIKLKEWEPPAGNHGSITNGSVAPLSVSGGWLDQKNSPPVSDTNKSVVFMLFMFFSLFIILQVAAKRSAERGDNSKKLQNGAEKIKASSRKRRQAAESGDGDITAQKCTSSFTRCLTLLFLFWVYTLRV